MDKTLQAYADVLFDLADRMPNEPGVQVSIAIDALLRAASPEAVCFVYEVAEADCVLRRMIDDINTCRKESDS